MDAPRAQACLDRGADYVLIGRAAILHHDFPNRAIADPDFASIALPASRDHLRAEAVSPRFMDYLATTWSDFVDA